jgi:hypothetical protein
MPPGAIAYSCTRDIGRVTEIALKQQGQSDTTAVILSQEVSGEATCWLCGNSAAWSIRPLVRTP